jgi:hypothetical protein
MGSAACEHGKCTAAKTSEQQMMARRIEGPPGAWLLQEEIFDQKLVAKGTCMGIIITWQSEALKGVEKTAM